MNEQETIAYLHTPQAIREKCDRIFTLACNNQSNYFKVNLSKLDSCADYVIQVMRDEYPTLEIPFHSRWRHFEVGNIARIAELDLASTKLSPIEKAKTKFDLTITSVLLDAGAGAAWKYEEETGKTFNRSEGLAVASYRMFCDGAFSSNSDFPYQADTKGLQITEESLRKGFQVSSNNFLVGLEGRVKLLQKLGQVITQHPNLFGTKNIRPGNLVDYLLKQGNSLPASTVFSAILEGLGNIWAGRITINNVNLGDVWYHPTLKDYIPFHKLSQWLTYSLLEPLQEIGVEITGLEELTGLPEYRNGGLCLDTGLLELKNPEIIHQKHTVDSELIVEWRALTVILLDRIAADIRQKLNLTPTKLPLVKVLQGGTWTAGRKIASQLREGSLPPIQIESDGTVF